jgi:transcriptional regulator with XRE-family HTH domain
MAAGDDYARRIADALRLAVEGAKLSLREVDRRLGWSENYLSQVLRGSVELKVSQVYDVLGVVGKKPLEFWREVESPAVVSRGSRPALDPSDSPLTQRQERKLDDAVGLLLRLAEKRPDLSPAERRAVETLLAEEPESGKGGG